MMERQTAKKACVSDIVGGSFVKKEGFEPSFVKTKRGDEISRARVLGTVVSKFVADDQNFASVTIDDGTETMRLKMFRGVKPLDKVEVGQIVDVIGKVREYEGEIYIIPEIAREVKDPNYELLRRAELLKKPGKKTGEAPKSGESPPKEKGPEFETAKDETPTKESGGKNVLKNEVLGIIESSEDGIVYSELTGKVKAKEAEIEAAIDELLNDGICYEPSPGKIRKI